MVGSSVDGVEFFVDLYSELYQFIVTDYKKRTGEDLKTYKEFEPEYLKSFYNSYEDEDEIIKQASNIVSKLIVIQALPNANHRTAFLFIRYYLRKQGINIRIYEDEQEKYDVFYKKSKFLIGRDINHLHLFNEKYLDVHHKMALDDHRKSLEILMKEIIELPQSGIRTVESFHSFVASMNQSGSFPSSNQ